MTAHDSSFIPRPGHIARVGAGPGAADRLILRAVDRLRQADVIFHDRLVAPEVPALAPTRTARVFVGKEVGAHCWTQPRINAAIFAAALQGQRVVRLTSGDPSIFGRACEEIDAARAARRAQAVAVAGLTNPAGI